MEDKRSFTIIKMTKRGGKAKSKTAGRYVSRSPMDAATKAFNRECRQSKIRGQCTLIVVIKETTKGSKGKRYVYRMKRVKLDNPVTKLINNKPVTYKYKTNATRVKQLSTKQFVKRVRSAGKITGGCGGCGMTGGGGKKTGGCGCGMTGGGKDDALTGFYNIISEDNIILHTDYFMYPEVKSEKSVYKDIMKKHKKEFKKIGVRNISIDFHGVMLYPKSEGREAIQEAMESQMSFVRESMNALSSYEVKARKKDAFDLSDLASVLDSL